MLDPRIYRTGLVAVVLAVIVFAFALRGQPGPLGTNLAPDAFNGQHAFANTLSLARGFPRRSPGSAQDAALARVIAAHLRTYGYGVREQSFRAATPSGTRSLTNVIGVQQGLSNTAVVVVAHRDALSSLAVAEQSGTGVLLELARVLAGETLNHTLVVVSTSGSAGAAGATQIAAGLGRPVDAVLALGNMAGAQLRRPLVVPWSDGSELAPPLLQDTVAASVRSQAGLSAGSPSLLGQLAELAFPLSLTEQAPFNSRGTPAVLLSASGARPAPVAEPVSVVRVTRLGRAALDAVNAIDGSHGIPGPSAYLRFAGKVVPEWVVQLLVLALIVPAAATAVDGFARARRRGYVVGRRIVAILAVTLPFLVALAVVVVLGATGLLNAPPGPIGPGTFPLGTVGTAVLASLAGLMLGLFAWLRAEGALRALVGRDGVGRRHRAPAQNRAANGSKRPEPLGDLGAVAATLIVACALALVVWGLNPFAALLLVPALHFWMLALAPAARIPGPVRLALLALGFALPALVVAYYLVTLGFGPLSLAWTGVLMIVGGQLGVPAAVLICLLLGVAVGAVANVLEIARAPVPETPTIPVTVRGPVTYAGPGSLGGTESALPSLGAPRAGRGASPRGRRTSRPARSALRR